MKIHRNTIYILSEETQVHIEGESLLLITKEKEKRNIPLRNVDNLIMLTWKGVFTAEAIRRCSEAGVSISIGNPNCKFLARAEGFPRGNITLRRAQYRFSDNTCKKLEISKKFVQGKINSQRRMIARHKRENNQSLLQKELKLKRSIENTKFCENEEELLGIEGDAAAQYFSIFNEFIKNPIEVWKGRSRRPPKSPINALLSFFYVLGTNDCKSALALTGLDPQCGIYHHDQPGRASLALDLLEEFRVRLGDQTAINLINKKQINQDDFKQESTGGFYLKENSLKKAIQYYQERKNEKIYHPKVEEEVTWGLIPLIQARLLARHIREEENYEPFSPNT